MLVTSYVFQWVHGVRGSVTDRPYPRVSGDFMSILMNGVTKVKVIAIANVPANMHELGQHWKMRWVLMGIPLILCVYNLHRAHEH